MQFSVIIPTYNRLELLKAALHSVWQQTFTDFEVIVADDGSTDGTWEWLQDFDHPKVRACRQQHLGPSAARNLAASQAVGQYLAFLDSDDLWFPWALSSYALALKQHGDAALLRASCIEFAGTPPSTPSAAQSLRASTYRDYLQAGAQAGFFVGAGLIAVRRDCFLKVGGFEPRLRCAEEHDLALRLGEYSGCVVIDAPTQVAYRRHADSSVENLDDVLCAVRVIIEREHALAYPGGAVRGAERRGVIARMARPVSFACLKSQRWRDAWQLYARLLPWTLTACRWKYLLGFPLIAGYRVLNGPLRR